MESLWNIGLKREERNALNGDIKADAVVVGAGMAGILCAYMLKEKGVDPIVIDADTAYSKVTAHTTAKITAQHGLIYDKLIRTAGREKAAQYAHANQAALSMYRQIIASRNIDCEYTEIPAHVYTLQTPDKLEREALAAERLGFNARYSDTGTGLPFQVSGILRFEAQAQFHPLLFLNEIAAGLRIYEHTRALWMDKNTVVTEKGRIRADTIIIATHYPLINIPGWYFIRMHQDRAYVLALENAALPDGAYISADGNGYSFRSHKNILLFGGAGHRTGKNHGDSYARLLNSARILYPQSKEVCRWSAQDCMTHDCIPFIGRYSRNTPNLYVATGFNKWGMTGSMVAAMLISDAICGTKNDCADVFSPARIHASAAPYFFIDAASVISNLVKSVVYLPAKDAAHISNGSGGIARYNGKKACVFKDGQSGIHAVSPRCSHLGCQLAFNADEQTWECPCHGSRYDNNGHLLNGPAQMSLKKINGKARKSEH